MGELRSHILRDTAKKKDLHIYVFNAYFILVKAYVLYKC